MAQNELNNELNQEQGVQPEPAFSVEQLDAILFGYLQLCPELFNSGKLLVGFSGGLDSTVLLHLLHTLHKNGQLQADISALHVHHGLAEQADEWLEHCRGVCSSLELVFHARKVQVALGRGQSPEAAARQARYAAFAEVLTEDSLLVQAHHQDDQVETVLMHLMRGSGPRGLAGIPSRRTFANTHIIRPLLHSSRELLHAYATMHQLSWIEDGSNSDQRYDRNYLRHTVIPLLQTRWPQMATKMQLSASLCAEADGFAMLIAEQDLQSLRMDAPNKLLLSALLELDEARQRNVLRHWSGELASRLQGTTISHHALGSIIQDVLPARGDGCPVVGWGEGQARLEVRRYNGALYLIKPLPVLPTSLLWDSCTVLQLPGMLGTLQLHSGKLHSGQCAHLPHISFEVRFRQGGESIKPLGRPTRQLKKLLQELAVPPWLRDAVPLIYLDGTLVAVAGLVYSESWAPLWSAQPGTPQQVQIHWQTSDLHCGY